MKRIPGGPVVTFFLLTYAVMWTCFFTVAAAGIATRSPLGTALVLLGAYSPSLAAIWLAVRAEGNSKDIVPSALPSGTTTFGVQASLVAWLAVTLLWVGAAYFLARMPKLDTRPASA